VRWLATDEGHFDAAVTSALTQLKAASKRNQRRRDLRHRIFKGLPSAISCRSASRFAGQTRYMALGDYANSRGASDMGVLPDRLPGYAPLSDRPNGNASANSGAPSPLDKAGLDAHAMMEPPQRQPESAVCRRRESAENFQRGRAGPSRGTRIARCAGYVPHRNAQLRADVVLPAASSYEKDGTLTNTAGEVQMTHRSIDPQGPRSDFDSDPHPFAPTSGNVWGSARRSSCARPKRRSMRFRQNVPGYDLSVAGLLSGGALQSGATAKTKDAAYDVPLGNIFSSNDFLFTSGTLGRYCSKLTSTKEAKDRPWISSPSMQSWWYR
jgi:NADH-quinone oxidoreductase subunit G